MWISPLTVRSETSHLSLPSHLFVLSSGSFFFSFSSYSCSGFASSSSSSAAAAAAATAATAATLLVLRPVRCYIVRSVLWGKGHSQSQECS